jgi:hypothetical protein
VKRRGDMTGRHGYGMLGRHVSVAIGRVQNRLPGCRAQRIRAPGKSAIDVKKPSSDETRRTLTWTVQPGCGHVLRHVLGCEQASPPRRVEKPEGEAGRSVTVGVPSPQLLAGPHRAIFQFACQMAHVSPRIAAVAAAPSRYL